MTVGHFSFGPQQGWECPKCGGVYSPTTPQCFQCPQATVTTTGACNRMDHLPNSMCTACGKPIESDYPGLCVNCRAEGK